MTVTIKKSSLVLHELALLNFEMKLGHKLPDDYRNFLLEYNGGEPEPNMIVIPGSRKTCSVTCLFGLYNFKKENDLAAKRKRLPDGIPETIIPIAAAEVEGFICISLDSADFGAVYLFNPALTVDPASRDSLTELAAGFSDFLDALQIYDPAVIRGGLFTRLFNSVKNLFS